VKATLLYAEDEENDALFMRLALRRVAPEVSLRVVEDGRNAVAWLAGEEPYDDRAAFPLPSVILLDLNLPMLSGLEVLHWIRQRPQFDRTPVVLFSSSGRADDRKVAEMLGADHYVVKPMSGDQFDQVALDLGRRWLDVPAAG
jgi:CheY-like chemotaxis protein